MAKKSELIYTRCVECNWRQFAEVRGGMICVAEYYCVHCGAKLLIETMFVDAPNKKDKDKKDRKDKNGEKKGSKQVRRAAK